MEDESQSRTLANPALYHRYGILTNSRDGKSSPGKRYFRISTSLNAVRSVRAKEIGPPSHAFAAVDLRFDATDNLLVADV